MYNGTGDSVSYTDSDAEMVTGKFANIYLNGAFPQSAKRARKPTPLLFFNKLKIRGSSYISYTNYKRRP